MLQQVLLGEFLRQSMLLDNAPPRLSILNDREMVAKFGWAPVANDWHRSIRRAGLK